MKCPPKNDYIKKVPQISDIIDVAKQNHTEVSMGRSKPIIQTGSNNTHFTWGERLKLQYHYNGTNNYSKITSPTLIGTLLSKSERIIRRELKRGKVEHLKSDLSKVFVYNAEYAQNDADSKSSAKGSPIKLGANWDLVCSVSELIKYDKHSPYAVILHFKRTNWPSDTRICEKTLYNYIYAGDITGVTEKNPIYAGRRRKAKSQPKKHSRMQKGVLISDQRRSTIGKKWDIWR